jgi:B-box zinc finger protein
MDPTHLSVEIDLSGKDLPSCEVCDEKPGSFVCPDCDKRMCRDCMAWHRC